MTDNVDGTIRHTLEANEVEFQRHFDAPLEDLWRFVSEPELLTKWMGGPVDKLEPQVGGDVLIQIAPKMGATVFGKVLEYVPQQVLALTWEVPAWGHTPDLMGTTMRWAVEADGDGSKLTLTHTLPHDVFREHLLAAAWHLHMDQLGQLLAGNDEHYTIQQPEIYALVLAYLEKDQAEKRAYYEHLLGIQKAEA
ncbi:SRPBCC domain-containing protein [Streptomyces mirabilis]|uniref:SRPBCC domain-containing protein n=1 Tax=Streptomyces mirabilis TaxID=68239 RepID=UPI003448950E